MLEYDAVETETCKWKDWEFFEDWENEWKLEEENQSYHKYNCALSVYLPLLTWIGKLENAAPEFLSK